MPVDDPERLPDGRGRRVGPEDARPAVPLLPRPPHLQPRVRVPLVEPQDDEVLVVPEPDVEARLCFLMSSFSRSTASFSERVTITSTSPSRSSSSGTKSAVVAPARVEVGADPGAQARGLADVDHLAGPVLHEVAAGLGRQRLQRLAEGGVHRANGLSAGAAAAAAGARRCTPPGRRRARHGAAAQHPLHARGGLAGRPSCTSLSARIRSRSWAAFSNSSALDGLLHVRLQRRDDLRDLLGLVLGPLLGGQGHGQVVGLDHRHVQVADVPLHRLRRDPVLDVVAAPGSRGGGWSPRWPSASSR